MRNYNYLCKHDVSDEDCYKCPWHPLCRGGCRRDRDDGDGVLKRSRLCAAYQEFFPYALPRMQLIAQRVAQGK